MDCHDESLATLEKRWQVDCRSNIETRAAPTAMPTTKPTATTSKSPAPFIGLLAGFGIAGLFLTRLRK